jgi:hypothetical protein
LRIWWRLVRQLLDTWKQERLTARTEKSDNRTVKRVSKQMKHQVGEINEWQQRFSEMETLYQSEIESLRRAKDVLEEELLDRIERVGRELACARLENEGMSANHAKFVKMWEAEAAVHYAKSRLAGMATEQEQML